MTEVAEGLCVGEMNGAGRGEYMRYLCVMDVWHFTWMCVGVCALNALHSD